MNRKLSGRTAIAAAATTLLAVALSAAAYDRPAMAAGGLPDGEYDCGGGYTYRAMGKVDIRNGQFRYRPYDTVVNGFAPYSLGADGRIAWGGPFGGLDEAPARIVETKREPFGFNVMYQGRPGALINTMSCHAPKAR